MIRRNHALDLLATEEVVAPGVARAAVLGVAVRCGDEFSVEVGCAGRAGEHAASPSTIFDLASVSKPFTAVAFARLAERGIVRPEQRLIELLPECIGSPAAAVTLEAALSHRAGFAPHRRLYRPLERRRALDRAQALREAAGSIIDSAPAPVYSDLGYFLAGAALERASGLALDALVEREIANPLGLAVGSARQWYRKVADFHGRVAPTEFVPFRGGWLRGVVHDENAWALAGYGSAGHAGLFGTLAGVLSFGVALLEALAGRRDDWLSPARVGGLVAERPGGTLRLGFDGKSAEGSSAGATASDRSFGHLGFTGTSLWCDPTAESVTALLTNRVCPTRANNAIRACRPRVHEALNEHGRALRAAHAPGGVRAG